MDSSSGTVTFSVLVSCPPWQGYDSSNAASGGLARSEGGCCSAPPPPQAPYPKSLAPFPLLGCHTMRRDCMNVNLIFLISFTAHLTLQIPLLSPHLAHLSKLANTNIQIHCISDVWKVPLVARLAWKNRITWAWLQNKHLFCIIFCISLQILRISFMFSIYDTVTIIYYIICAIKDIHCFWLIFIWVVFFTRNTTLKC